MLTYVMWNVPPKRSMVRPTSSSNLSPTSGTSAAWSLCNSAVLMAQVDDAKPVTVRISQHHEVRVDGIAVPVDPLGAERNQTCNFGCSLCRIRHMQVEMGTRMLTRWRLAELQRNLGPSATRRLKHRRPSAKSALAQLVTQRLAPELGGASHVRNTQHDHADSQHAAILPSRWLIRNAPDA